MRFLRRALPYLVGVLAMYLVLYASAWASGACGEAWTCFGVDQMSWGSVITVLYMGAMPAVAFFGASLLGYRWGYDWVTALLCVALAVVIPDPLSDLGEFNYTWSRHDTFFIAGYLVILNLGLAVGMLINAMLNRQPSPTLAESTPVSMNID